MMIFHVQRLACLFGALAMCAAGPPGSKSGSDAEIPAGAIEDQLIIRLHENADINQINAKHNTTTLAGLPEHRLFLVQLPEQIDPNGLMNLLAVDKKVEWTQFNVQLGISGGHTQSFFVSVSIEAFEDQYLFELIEPAEMDDAVTGDGVVVAVLDTGIDASHELLAGRVLESGYNFIKMMEDTGETIEDEGGLAGHGTFMAGVIAGLAPDVQLLPVTVLDESGTGDLFHLIAGIDYAIEMGAKVINISVGSEHHSEAMDFAVDLADEAGALIVASAGNDDASSPALYPAADPRTIAVAATNADDKKGSFSNYGEHIDLCAPGTQVVSALPGNEYAVADGSSISAAAVSAGAATVRLLHPELDAQAVRQVLEDGAVNIDPLNAEYFGLLGNGRLHIEDALCMADGPKNADLNDDGRVNYADFAILITYWGMPADCSNDLSGDGRIGINDVLILLSQWGG